MPEPKIPEGYTDTGYLQVKTTAARGAVPLAESHVSISALVDGEMVLYRSTQTNSSGLTEVIPLPAPPKNLSAAPSSLKPYGSYQAQITHSGYRPVTVTDIPVFASVTALLPADLTPIEIGQTTENPINIVSQAQDL